MNRYDCIIIGGGISGVSLCFELSRFSGRVLLIEKENDVACGTTRANSAVIHAGYDPVPGTLMARYNVLGSEYIKQLCADLNILYKQIGSLVLGFGGDDDEVLRRLLQQGLQNGVSGIEIISAERIFDMEPNISRDVKSALYAPSAAIVSPWELCLALAECAYNGGVQFKFNTPVTKIKKQDDEFIVNDEFSAPLVVNAAGVYSDIISGLAGTKVYETMPSKGEYYLLDKSQGETVNHVIFTCPTKKGKGVLVAPTVHGNLIVGPSAGDCTADDTSTTKAGLLYVSKEAKRSVPGISLRDNVRNFAGIRDVTSCDDFIFGKTEIPGFYNLAGMKSPGLSAAPALARELSSILTETGFPKDKNPNFCNSRTVVRVGHLSHSEKAELIKKNPRYGHIVCRCETVSEGEVIDALHRSFCPPSLDAIKRRCFAGSGRCSGGFCGPLILDIITRELGILPTDVLQDAPGSEIIVGVK